jgi:hypothetical protein
VSKTSQPTFRKSLRCGDGACVEVSIGDRILVRNSTRPEVVVAFTAEEWRVFLSGIREGEFAID